MLGAARTADHRHLRLLRRRPRPRAREGKAPAVQLKTGRPAWKLRGWIPWCCPTIPTFRSASPRTAGHRRQRARSRRRTGTTLVRALLPYHGIWGRIGRRIGARPRHGARNRRGASRTDRSGSLAHRRPARDGGAAVESTDSLILEIFCRSSWAGRESASPFSRAHAAAKHHDGPEYKNPARPLAKRGF